MRLVPLTLLVAAALTAGAQEPAPPKSPPPDKPGQSVTGIAGDTSPLVKASRAAKTSKRPKSKHKVITNADLKKAKSTLATTAPPPVAKVEPSRQPAPHSGSVSIAEEAYRNRKEAEARLATADRRVRELQAELDQLEQDFYDAKDPSYRDSVIQPRFIQTRRQLESARADLAAARDALTAAGGKP